MWPTDYGDDYPSGDSRRCPAHPNIVISSPDGLFDGICGACEAAMDADRADACGTCGVVGCPGGAGCPDALSAELIEARSGSADTQERGCGSGIPPHLCHERDSVVLRRMGHAIPASAFDDDIPF